MSTIPTMSVLLADVRARFSRERDLLLAVGAPFLFLPSLAVQLLTAPPPPLPVERTSETMTRWIEALTAWGQGNAGWYLLADAIAVYGLATLALLFVSPERPTVGTALVRAATLYPRFLLANILTAIPVGAGMWLLVLPGLFFQARLIATAAALAAEQPLSAGGSLSRSWRLTTGHGGVVFAALVALFLMQWLALAPLASLDGWLRQPAHLNPFVLALVDGGMSAVAALYQAALLLLGIAAYRRAS